MIRPWHCFAPGVPCTPDDPCGDMCGYVIGTLEPLPRPIKRGEAVATGPAPSPESQ